MDNVIFEFLSKYLETSDEEMESISQQNVIKSFKKGAILLSEGEISGECYFVLKGCVYSYYLVEGEVKVTGFYMEKQPVTNVSYTTKKPSEYYLECLEDTIVAISTSGRSKELLSKVPRLSDVSSIVLGDQLANQQMKYDDFIKLSPEKRYQNLQEKSPDLLNRIPQYLIASYLGIKPESLSRIRKRLVK